MPQNSEMHEFEKGVVVGYHRNGRTLWSIFSECNNRIVMVQRKHLEDVLRGRIIGLLECGRNQLEVSEELGIAQGVISRL
ncbi:transposable element Tcb1 transposase [Trichonephila clavipes]|nr:transposable element Tcb1 transposase [Trichonephila clavipes]